MRLGSGMNLYLVLIISAIAFFTLLAYPILFVFPKLNKLVHDYQLSNLNDQLDLVMSLVKLYHSDSIADLMDEESAKKEVLKQIKSFLYGPEGKDYFFVLDTNGVVLAHPYYPELEGQSGLESDDVVFKKAVGNIVQGARQGKNCVEYEWYIYGERKTQRKLTVIRVFEPWSWIIGTGFYRQVLTEQIRKIRMNFWQVEGIFATSFLLILIVFLQVMKRYHLEKEQLLNKFQQEKERLHAILSSIPTPIIIFEELEPTFMNEAFKSTFSIEKSNVEVFRSNILEALKQFAMEAQKKKTSMNRSLRLNDVQERWFHVHIVPRFENGICEVIFVLTEITEHMQEINLWKTRAETDTLTGLANRSILRELEEHTFVLGKNFCVLMLDVDDFKQINDKYGHTVGDLVLKEFAKRLSQSVRKDAVLIRYGGDEFLTIIPNIDVENALRVAKRFQESLKQKFNALEVTLILSASIGISEFPKDGHDLQSLIDSADKRLYKAKASGKGSICAD